MTRKEGNNLKEISWKSILCNLGQLVFIMLFISITSTIFGSNHTLVWVAIEVSLVMYYKMNIGIDKKEAPFVIMLLFLLIGIANRIAMLNIFLGVGINLLTIFIIMYVPSTKAEYKPYMPFILCYIFGQSTPAIGKEFGMRMLSLLVGSILVSIVYYVAHRKSEEKHLKVKEMITSIDITSDRFIIAMKMAIGVTIAILIGSLFGIKKTMWIALSVMSITQIKFEHTKKRFKYRIISTVIGCIVFVILFQILIPSKYTVLATIILSYIYTFVEDYHIQMVFVTVNALSASMILFDPTTAVELRIILVIIGCMLGYIINKLDFRKWNTKLKEKLEKKKLCENNG